MGIEIPSVGPVNYPPPDKPVKSIPAGYDLAMSDAENQSPQPLVDYGRPTSAYGPQPPASRGQKAARCALLVLGVLFFFCVFVDWGAGPAPRHRSREVKCKSNLRQIALAVQDYAGTFGGIYPDGFGDLLTSSKLSPWCLICAETKDTPARQPSDLLSGGHCSYVYLGAGMNINTTQPTDVLAYDAPANHADGYNIIFADNHVAVFDPVRGAKLIAAAETAM